MPNYGDPGSGQRGQWWDVVKDVSIAYKALQLGSGSYFTSRALWMAEPRAGVAGSRLAAGNWPTKLRDRAKAVAGQTGIAWKAGNFANLSKGRGYARQLRAQAEAMAPALDSSSDDPYGDDLYDLPPEDQLLDELDGGDGGGGWDVPEDETSEPWGTVALVAGVAGSVLAAGWLAFRVGVRRAGSRARRQLEERHGRSRW